MNVLLTSAGRRASLLQAFQAAAHPLGLQVFAADMDPLAPAVHLADKAFRVPRVTDPAYVPTLLSLVEAHDIQLVVPTIDTELAILARHAEDFQVRGAHALISSREFVEICGDKWLTFSAFQREAIAVPDSWLPNALPRDLPEALFLKPRDGSASAHTYACSRLEFPRILPIVPNAIVQERLQGEEVTIDALLDFEGSPLHYVPRTRIRTLGGESIQGVTLSSPDLDPWIESVLKTCGRLGATGPITLQCFRTSRGPVLTEINPRFGGGFPLARAAGGDYPAWLLAHLMGGASNLHLGHYKRGLYMTRAYHEIFTETLPWSS